MDLDVLGETFFLKDSVTITSYDKTELESFGCTVIPLNQEEHEEAKHLIVDAMYE